MNSDIFKSSLLPNKDKIEFVKLVQQEYKYIDSIKYRPSLTLWQFNIETGELKSAKVTVKEQLVWTSKGNCTKKTRSVIIALLIVLAIFLVEAISYMYYHRMETVWYVQMMIALVLSLFVLGGIILIAFSIESFCSVVSLLQDVSVTALSPR